jgi:hypothetical protein
MVAEFRRVLHEHRIGARLNIDEWLLVRCGGLTPHSEVILVAIVGFGVQVSLIARSSLLIVLEDWLGLLLLYLVDFVLSALHDQ